MQIAVIDNVLLRLDGPEHAPTIVCLHGFADSSEMFRPLFETELVQRYRLLAVDLPGFGASPGQEAVGTISEHAEALAALLVRAVPGGRIGLVGHSIASPIAIETIDRLPQRPLGLFSIEGNLTADDAYFSGLAADYESSVAFKQAFVDRIWEMAQSQPILRRYHGTAVMAEARAMWRLGRDAKRISVGDGPGQAFAAVPVPTLYYWSPDNTPKTTRDWIAASGLANRRFSESSHWPSIDQPAATAGAIMEFFDSLCPGA